MRHLSRAPRTRGLTLIELMVAIAIVGVLLVAAAPGFTDYITNSRLREGGNLLYTETLLAQSEAIKRNTRIRVSTNGALVQTLDMTNPLLPVEIRQRTIAGGVTMVTQTFEFGGDGRTFPFGTAVAIDLSTASATCSTEIRCPGLRVDGGGSIRLCGDHTSCP